MEVSLNSKRKLFTSSIATKPSGDKDSKGIALPGLQGDPWRR